MRTWKPDRTTIFLIGVALALAVLAWAQGGAEKAFEGLVVGGRTLISVTPLLLAAFLLAGLIQVLVSREVIERWLGARSGWRGILLACFAGALIPGGPYVYYPLAGALLHSGAGLGALVAFVTAKNLWSVTRLPYEFALLGTQLTLIRYGLTLVIPPMLGMVAESLFGRAIDRIRESVQ
jgi:uncharacterized membrane protein YraQ (UPF0718 family)